MAFRGWVPELSPGGFDPRDGSAPPGGSRTYRLGWGFRFVFWGYAALFAE
jgi:hypothetical protein